jgi:hypothetical protein
MRQNTQERTYITIEIVKLIKEYINTTIIIYDLQN